MANVYEWLEEHPKPAEIKEIFDYRRVGRHSRKSYYLAKTIDGIYYWFYSPRTDRDPDLRRLISEYRHKLGEEGVDMEPRTRTLRSGRTFAG
jgi:hypothetical protein